MSHLDELYREVILDHNKSPRNRGELPGANRSARGYNPFCGDEVRVYLSVEGGVIKDVHFEGSGCAISVASASMMTGVMKGKSVEEAAKIIESIRKGLTDSPAELEAMASESEELNALAGVREFPIRIKCATLAWHTLGAALRGIPETEEGEAHA